MIQVTVFERLLSGSSHDDGRPIAVEVKLDDDAGNAVEVNGDIDLHDARQLRKELDEAIRRAEFKERKKGATDGG